MEPLLYAQGMTDAQKLMFMSEFNQRRKDGTTALLMALFLGGLGGHRFYMGQVGWGILYLCFFWTFIPAFVALVELFLMRKRVARHNDRVAQEIALTIKAHGSASTA